MLQHQQQQLQLYKLRLLLQQVMLHFAGNIPEQHPDYADICHWVSAQLNFNVNYGLYFAPGALVQQQQQQQLPNHASSDPWLQAHPPAEWVADVLPLILRLCDSLMDGLEARSAAAAGALPATSSSSSGGGREPSEMQALALFITSLNTIILSSVVGYAADDQGEAIAAEGNVTTSAATPAAEAAGPSGGGCYCLQAVLEQLPLVLQCLERAVRCMSLPAVRVCGRADVQSCTQLTLDSVLQLCSEEIQMLQWPCLPRLAAACPQPQQLQQQLYSLVVSLLKACQADEGGPHLLEYITIATHASLGVAMGLAGSTPSEGVASTGASTGAGTTSTDGSTGTGDSLQHMGDLVRIPALSYSREAAGPAAAVDAVLPGFSVTAASSSLQCCCNRSSRQYWNSSAWVWPLT
jgi:hypothetical protein